MNIENAHLFNDEHESDTFFQRLGYIHLARKIFRAEDCQDMYQKKCWSIVNKPFLYVYGELAGPDHPNAAAAAALIRYSLKNPEYAVGLSVEGSTAKKNGNVLEETIVRNVSLTVKPANPDCKIFPVMDLTKSIGDVALPEKYKNATGNRKQFRNIPSVEQLLLAKSSLISQIKALAKSSDADVKGATVVKCWNCGSGKIFMKSNLPNKCVACGESFSMNDIFRARTNSNSAI